MGLTGPQDSPIPRDQRKRVGSLCGRGWNGVGGLASKGLASLSWQPTETRATQTQEIINPNQALPSQEARLALVTEKSCPQERPELLPSGELRPPPLSLQPPPPLLFPVTTCKLKSNLSVSLQPSTPRLLLDPRPTPPHPTLQAGPQLQEARPSVIPRTLLSTLGPSGQIKPLSHTPRKAQGQMGRDKRCQIIDPPRPGLGRALTAAPHMAVRGGKGAPRGGRPKSNKDVR